MIFLVLMAAALPLFGGARYTTTSDWGSGFCGEIAVTNDTGAALSDWTLEFDFDRSLTSVWEGTVASRNGNRYVVKPSAYNGPLGVGRVATIGFCGAPGNLTTAPSNLRVVSAAPVTPPATISGPATVTIRVTSRWNEGYGADIVLLNSTNQAINGWRLSFTLDSEIQSLWNGTLSSLSGTYTVTNESWNGVIATGASVHLGFMGSGAATAAGNCILNGAPCTISVTQPVPGTPNSGVAGSITIDGVDGATPVDQVSVRSTPSSLTLTATSATNPVFRVMANNPRVVQAAINGRTLQLTGLMAGRSGLRIEETSTGTVRHLGVRVLNADGSVPTMPKYLSIGAVSEDTSDHLGFWRTFDSGLKSRFVDLRYIYLNGGPVNGWNTWSNSNGGRLVSYIRNSKQLGMIPFFVWYNIPAGGESYVTNLQNIQNQAYMKAYFQNLKLALDLIAQESPDEMVGMVLEPDFLGYLAQNSGLMAAAIPAFTQGAYEAGVLQAGVDLQFPNTVLGLVQAINYTIRKYTPKVWFGWQVNLWASPASGWSTSIPGKGIIQKTETAGIAAGRAAIANEATAIANYYVNAGIASYGAKFVAMDKYGLDAVGYEAGAAQDPSQSTWFWNNDLWGNYLVFARSLWQATGLKVIPWQLPAGHINSSRESNPYDLSGVFGDLANTTNQYEDSAPTYFFGDTFTASGRRLEYFGVNRANDPGLRVSGSSVTWAPHMTDAASSGILTLLFGPGVGISTTSIGALPGDRFWWISKVQKYLTNPVALP